MGQEPGKKVKSEVRHERKEKKPKMNKLMGTVEAVDMATGRITVKDHKDAAITMLVGAEVKVMKAGKPAAMADIVAGEKVHVLYEGEATNPVVKEIKIVVKEGRRPEKAEKMEKSSEPKPAAVN